MFKILILSEEKNLLLEQKLEQANLKDLNYMSFKNLKLDSDFLISFHLIIFQIKYPLFPKDLELAKDIRSLFPGIFVVLDYYDYYKNRNYLEQAKVDLYYPLVDGVDSFIVKCRQLLVGKFMFSNGALCYKDIILDLENRSCIRGNKIVQLRNREFELLKFLLENPKRIFSSSQLLEAVWDMNSDLNTNTVQSHISFLRKKIDVGFKEKLLHTVSCVGYKIE